MNLDAQRIQTIRQALLIGLSCYGELERIDRAARTLASSGNAVPEDMEPREVADDAIDQLVSALMILDDRKPISTMTLEVDFAA